MSTLSHLDADGRARMVDVSSKPATARTATAEGVVACAPETLALVRDGRTPKGAVIATAELAGVMGGKRTAELIPLCHPLAVASASIDFAISDDGIIVTAQAVTAAQTGVEMEAMTAVSIALLTIYDMVKAIDKSQQIDSLRLILKEGGKSGTWRAD